MWLLVCSSLLILLPLLAAVPDTKHNDFLGLRPISIPQNIVRLPEWHDQFTNIWRARRPASLRKCIQRSDRAHKDGSRALSRDRTLVGQEFMQSHEIGRSRS